jgi:chromosomal replication initiator protein
MDAEWVAALPSLRRRVGERNFATWIEPIHCERDEHGLRLEVSSRFFQEWVTRHFVSVMREVLTELGTMAPVRVIVAPRAPTGTSAAPLASPRTAAPAPPRSPKPAAAPRIGRLVPDYTFSRFVVGPANKAAYEAARSVAECPGRRFNPLFLWGGVGLGKTHLINAVAHELLACPPRRSMACLAAETFMNSMITSLRQDQMNGFRDRYREVDVLILDDVEFLAGKERTQEEFFHTFNALHAAGRQIVLTSDKPPHAIAGLEQRLRSRFEGGLIADIHPPTHQMRLAILVKKAGLQGVDLQSDVAQLIAQRSGPSVRELEGALTRVLATVALQGVPLTVTLVENLLAPVRPPSFPVSVESIQETVSQRFHLSVADLKSHRREQFINFPRQLAMYLSRTVAAASFPSIAEKFGGRDHSTVMHAVRVVEQRREDDPSMGQLLVSLETELRARPN